MSSKPRIKFGDFKMTWSIRNDIDSCLNSGHLTMGNVVSKFEEEWGKINETPFNVAMNNGTSALIGMFLSLYEYGARPGMEVIVPSLSFIASYTSIIAAGFKPVFVDIELDSLNIDTSKIEQKINDNTIAILGVSLMGKPYKAEIVQKICHKYDLWHFCDNCEGHLCKRLHRRMEYFCDAACYSFFAAHAAFSVEGGIISTFNGDLARLLQSIRNHGRDHNYNLFNHIHFGLNLKPSDLHMSVGLDSLRNIQETIKKRRDNLQYLQKALVDKTSVILSLEEFQDFNCPHALSIIQNPEDISWSIPPLKEALEEENIEFKRNFGAADSHKALERFVIDPEDVENARWAGEGIHIGVHQYLTDEELDRIKDTLLKVII